MVASQSQCLQHSNTAHYSNLVPSLGWELADADGRVPWTRRKFGWEWVMTLSEAEIGQICLFEGRMNQTMYKVIVDGKLLNRALTMFPDSEDLFLRMWIKNHHMCNHKIKIWFDSTCVLNRARAPPPPACFSVLQWALQTTPEKNCANRIDGQYVNK